MIDHLTPEHRKQVNKILWEIRRAPRTGIKIENTKYSGGQFTPLRINYELEQHEMPKDLDSNHLRTLDLHKMEPTWNKHGKGMRNKYGGVIFNPHGHVLMVEPANHWAGYTWTFPKGGADMNEHPVDTGLREVKEETGHDTSILGLIPKMFKSGSGPGGAHYFVMRSHGQTSKPDFETQDVRWFSPEEAHKMIDLTDHQEGRSRDHEVLNMAINHFNQLKSNPEINDRFRQNRQVYEKTSCHCGCNKCAASQVIDRLVYSRHKRNIINHILCKSRKSN